MGGGECGRGIPMKYRNCSFRNRWLEAVFSLFFSIFLYSGVASGSFFGPQALCDPL